MLHPDYQYDPRAVPLLIAPLISGDADMTFGSRFAGMAQPREGGMPTYRFLGNRITTTMQNMLLGTRFSELHSGMRAYTRKFLLSMPFLSFSDGFDFDAQMLCGAIVDGHSVIEVPIRTRYTSESSSIAIPPSLHYVARSVAEAAKATATKGRRGSRSKMRLRGRRADRLPAQGPVAAECLACGDVRHALIYPATADQSASIDPSEFTCTSDKVNEHDDIVQCTSCGVVRSIPTLDQEEITDLYEATEDRVYEDEETGRRELFEWVVDRMNEHYVPDKRLIEFGSHMGMFLDTARDGGWLARGVEPSAWSVKTGKKRFGVALEQGTIEGVETPIDPYQAVVMLDMLEHVTDPHAALGAARRVIADEGLLALSTIDISSIHAKVRKHRWPWFIRPHLWYYTPETLFDHVERAGFEPVAWHTVPRWFHLSYVLERGESVLGPVANALEPITKLADPRIPTGWLGDIVLLLARAK